MPPVFEQPGGNRGSSGGDHYAQLASALQSRYASDAANQLHAQLGYAQLDQQRLAQQQNFELGVAHMQLQPILQEQHARAQMDGWMMQQQFNQQDQADLNRQNSVLSELMEKRDKGDISDGEFYAQARQVAPRVDLLKAKEQHTANAALAEQRKQKAANFEDLMRMRDRAAAYQDQELEGKLDLYIPPRYSQRLSEIMADGHPDLQSGTSEYSAQLKAEADAMGWATPYAKDKNGTPIHQKEVMDYRQNASGEGGGAGAGKMGRTGGTEMDAAHHSQAYMAALKHVQSLAKETDKETGKPAHPEYQSLDDQLAAAEKIASGGSSYVAKHFAAGKTAKATAEQTKAAVDQLGSNLDEIKGRGDLTETQKAGAALLVPKLQHLMSRYKSLDEMPASVKAQYQQLKTAFQGLSTPLNPAGGRPVDPATQNRLGNFLGQFGGS